MGICSFRLDKDFVFVNIFHNKPSRSADFPLNLLKLSLLYHTIINKHSHFAGFFPVFHAQISSFFLTAVNNLPNFFLLIIYAARKTCPALFTNPPVMLYNKYSS